MISSKEICQKLSLPDFGKSISLNCYTTLDQPKNKAILFLKNKSKKSLEKLSKHKESFFILPKEMENDDFSFGNNAYTFHENPRKVFFEVIEMFFSHPTKAYIDPEAFIGKDVEIGQNVSIGPGAKIIGKSVIEDGVSVGPNALIIGNCKIGANSVIASGVIIGEESLSIRYEEEQQYQNLQLGGVIIGKNSRVGVFSTISRGSIGDTILEENVFMGEYTHVGHNSFISSHSVLTLRSSICGSVQINKPCWLGPHSVILNGVKVTEKIKLGTGSVLQSNAKKSGTYFGNPAKILRFNNKSALN